MECGKSVVTMHRPIHLQDFTLHVSMLEVAFNEILSEMKLI